MKKVIKDFIDKYPNMSENDAAFYISNLNLTSLTKLRENLNDSYILVNQSPFDNKKSTINKDIDNVHENLVKRATKSNYFHDMSKLWEITNEGTQKKSTGSQLIKHVTKVNEMNFNGLRGSDMIDYQDLRKTVSNFKSIYKHGGRVVSYDYETLAGQNSLGHQQNDFITEYSITVSDVTGIDNLNLKKPDPTKMKRGEYEKALAEYKKKLKDIQINNRDKLFTHNENLSRSSLLGFSDNEYNKVKTYIKSLENKTDLTSRDNVYLKRLSMMADPNIDFDYHKNGFDVNIAKTSDDIEVNVKNALKGLEKYRDIGRRQEAWIANNISGTKSLESYKAELIGKVDRLASQGIDFNGNKIGKFVTAGHNIYNYDRNVARMISGVNNEILPGTQLDTYQIFKIIEEQLGYGQHLSKGQRVSNEFGSATQDAIKKARGFFDETLVGSHNANEDERTLVKMLFGLTDKVKNGETLGQEIIDKMSQVDDILKDKVGVQKAGNNPGVFLYTNGAPSEDFGKRALSFTYHPATKQVKTFSGYNISNTGEVTQDINKQWGPKKNGLYTKEDFEVDLNKENWNELFESLGMDKTSGEEFFQNYKNLNKVYVSRMQEYISPDEAKKYSKEQLANRPVHFLVAQDASEISNASVKVGKINKNGDFLLSHQMMDKLEYFKTEIDDNGNIISKKLTNQEIKKQIVDKAATSTMYDSVGRDIRESQVRKILKYNEFKKVNDGLSISKYLSELVAQNKQLKIEDTQTVFKQLVDVIGYSYKGQKGLTNESFGKALEMDKVTQSFDRLFDSLVNNVKKDFGEDIFNVYNVNNPLDKKKPIKAIAKNSISNQNEYKYNLIFDRMMDTLHDDFKDNETFKRLTSKATPMQGADFNVIDFLRKDVLINDKTKFFDSARKENSRYVSLNLNNRNALLNMFFNDRYGSDKSLSKKGSAGINALYEAFTTINSDPRFKDRNAFGFITKDYIKSYARDEMNVMDLGNKMQNELLKTLQSMQQSTGNQAAGLLFERRTTDYNINPEELSKFMKSLPQDYFDKLYTRVKNSLPENFVGVSGTDDEMRKMLLDNYFLNFNESDIAKKIKNLNGNDRNYILNQLDYAKQDAASLADDLISAAKEANANLIVSKDKTNRGVFLLRDNQIEKLNLYSYTERNGNIFTSIGNDLYNTQLGLNASEYTRANKNNVNNFSFTKDMKISTTNERYRQTRRSLTTDVAYANRNELDAIDQLVKSANKLTNGARQVAPRVEASNFANLYTRQFGFDMNDIIKVLPDMQNEIKRLETDYNIDPANIRYIQDLINNMADNIKVDGRVDGIDDILTVQKTALFRSYVGPLIDLAGTLNDDRVIDFNGEKVSLSSVTKRLNNNLKDNDFQKMIVMGINNPMFNAFGHVDDNARPPVMQQAGFETYDASKAKQAIDDMIAKTDSQAIKDSLNSIKLTNNAALTKGYELEKALGDRKAGAIINSLQIDNNNLSKIFRDDVIDAKSLKSNNKFYQTVKNAYGDTLSESEIKDIARQLADRTTAFSTYEQQSIMNSRIAANIFNVENKKVVKGKNRLIETHIANLETIENTKTQNAKLTPVIDADGNIRYQVGKKVDAKDVLGVFGENEVEKTTRFKGILRGRYQDEYGNNVSETELNKFIKKYIKDNDLLTHKKELNADDKINIFRALESKWDYNYEVIRRNASGSKKLFTEASEKTTYLSMELGLGSVDKNILKDLKDIGINETSGVLSNEYHEYLKEQIKNSTTAEHAKNLIDRIEKERHLLSDAVSEFDVIKKNNIHQLLAVNTMKHSSVSIPLSNIINNDELYNAFKEHDLFDKFFDGTVKFEDGRLITDGIKGVNLREENINKMLSVFDKDQQERFKNIIYGKNSLVDLSGEVAKAENEAVGHIFNALVVQAKDDASGISTTNEDVSRLKAQRDSYKSEISRIEEALESPTMDQKRYLELSAKKEQLEQSIEDIGNRLNVAAQDKGLKYSERMDLNLNRVKYNQSRIDLIKKNIGDQSLFDRAFGTVLDENGYIRDDYKGKSILENVTNQLRKQVSLAHGETSLASVADRQEYKYLIDSYKGNLKNISVERAEMAYSINKGAEAIAFNDLEGRKQHALVEKMTAGSGPNSYKLVDMSNRDFDAANTYLDLDIGKQGNIIKDMPNNPYSNNIMLKTGLGGNEEYLAIGRMPTKHFDDALIKENHISMLSTIQRDIKDLNSGNLSSKERESLEKSLRSRVQKLKRLQIQDVTGKEGLMGKIQESRLGSSFIGKASGLTIKGRENLIDGTKEGLRNFAYENSEALSKAKFMGKSLIDHYANNRFVDVAFMSEQAFKDMGYFDKDYMANIFDNMDKKIKNEVFSGMEQTAANHEAAMKNLLSTYGDNFIGTRFPEIQEGSDKMVMGYLDSTLAENQIRVMGHTGMSAKLDHDGDQFFMARNQLANKSESYLNYITGMNVSDEMKGVGQATEASMLSRAVNENIYWDRKIQKHLAKEQKIAVSGNRLEEIGKRVIIDGKLRAKLNSTDYINEFDLRKMTNDYEHQNLINDSIKAGSTDEAVDWLKSNYSGEELESQLDKFSNAYVGRMYLDERIAKSSRFAVGETNVTNFKLKNIISHSLDSTAADYEYKSNILTDMLYQAEEAVISSKSSVETLHQADRAKIWNDSAKNLLLGRGNSAKNKEIMSEWMDKNLSGAVDYSYHYQTSDYFKGIVKDIYGDHDDETILKMFEDSKYDDKAYELQKKMSNDLIDMIESMQDNRDVKSVLESSSLGYSVTGVKKPLKNATAMEDSVMGTVSEMLNNMSASQLDDFRMGKTSYTMKAGEDTLYKKVFKETTEEASKGETVRGILRGVGEMFEHSKGPSKLTMGALGLAAGVMAVGFVGGRPTPADTQAMEQAQQSYTPMDGPLQLADTPQISAGANQGYVVNINARTDKGRDHAAQAIQQAISSALPSNVNIAMNINNNYGNINNRDVEAAMMDALGY